MGIGVVYFDSESAIDPAFLERAGCDLESLMYIQHHPVEFVLETIEDILGATDDKMLFIWDSLRLPHQYQMLKETSIHNHLCNKGSYSCKGYVKANCASGRQACNISCPQSVEDHPTGTMARQIAMTTPYYSLRW